VKRTCVFRSHKAYYGVEARALQKELIGKMQDRAKIETIVGTKTRIESKTRRRVESR
jgi:hypothetical protein